MNAEKRIITTLSTFAKFAFFIRFLICNIVTGITESIRRVVDEGYDASKRPSIKIGL